MPTRDRPCSALTLALALALGAPGCSRCGPHPPAPAAPRRAPADRADRADRADAGHRDADALEAYHAALETPPEVAARALAVGAQAPAVELRDAEGRAWSLRDALARGAVVLLFYRGSQDRFSRSQLRHLNQSRELFARAGAAPVAVSVDPPEAARAYAAESHTEYPLLSDPDRAVMRSYGIEDRARGGAWPAMFLITRDGRVAWRWLGDTFRPHPRSYLVLEILAELARDAGR